MQVHKHTDTHMIKNIQFLVKLPNVLSELSWSLQTSPIRRSHPIGIVEYVYWAVPGWMVLFIGSLICNAILGLNAHVLFLVCIMAADIVEPRSAPHTCRHCKHCGADTGQQRNDICC